MESLYGVTSNHKKIYISFVRMKIGDKKYTDKDKNEFFKVVKITSFDFGYFSLNFTVCDFYGDCM